VVSTNAVPATPSDTLYLKEYVFDIATVYLILMIDGNLEHFEVECVNSYFAQEKLKELKQLLK